MARYRLGFALLCIALGLGLYLGRDGLLRQPAPAFSLPVVYGGQVDLNSYRGHPVLLVFWTTSCPICQRELPMLSQLEGEFRNHGVDIVAVHLGGEDQAAAFLDSNRVNLTCTYDSDGQIGRAYGVGGVPKLVLVGEDGKIKRSRTGWTSESVLRDWIE